MRLRILAGLALGSAIALIVFDAGREATIVPQPEEQAHVQEQTAPREPLTILFGGDLFFDRAIRRAIEREGVDYLWRDIEELLARYPYKVANLEGPIWRQASSSPANSFSFAFQAEHVRTLKDLGFTAVSLANNHTLNQGAAGLANTRAALDAIGILYFGDPDNASSSSFLLTEMDGERIALVGEHDLIASGQKDIERVVADLKQQEYFVIVYPHWGAEYVTNIPNDERARAHALVDAGADLIIGAHPHVVQPVELYKGKAIFYSLGNFLFDQYFSFDTMHGLLLGMEMEDERLTFALIVTAQDPTYQIHIAEPQERSLILDRMAAGSHVPEEVRQGIREGRFSIPRQ